MNSTTTDNSLDVLDDPASVWMLRNGSAKLNVSELDPAVLGPLDGNTPPSGTADLTKFFTISQTGIVMWVVDRSPYSEPTTPILYGNTSYGWQANTTIHMSFNLTIGIIMRIANDSMVKVGFSHPLPNLLWPAALKLFYEPEICKSDC